MRELKRRGLVLGFAAMFLLSAASFANVFLLDYSGFDWTAGGELGEPGSCYDAVGYVNSVNPTYLNFDYGTFEYTFHLEYSCFVSADTFGTFAVYEYGPFGPLPAMFSVFCDSIATGTAGDYGINPANATSPSTFRDGELVLGGDFTSLLTFVVDLSTGDGSMQGEIQWNTGSQLGNIPPSSRDMSVSLNGIKAQPVGGPEGYLWQIDGQIQIEEPVATQPTSWGALKTTFRGGN